MFPNWSGWNYLLKTLEPRQLLFKQTIEDHKRTLSDGHPRDFIDNYLLKVKNTDDSNSSFHHTNAGI